MIILHVVPAQNSSLTQFLLITWLLPSTHRHTDTDRQTYTDRQTQTYTDRDTYTQTQTYICFAKNFRTVYIKCYQNRMG